MTTPTATVPVMPIMKSKYITSMPMAMLDNNQAKKNHGQTLERLAARGGLASSEALAIMDSKHWGAYAVCDENDRLLANRVKRFEEQQASLAVVRRCPYCAKLPSYNHRDGVPICKCPDLACDGSERWLEYEEFDEQRLATRSKTVPAIVFIDWKWIELPASLKEHPAFPTLEKELAAIGVKVRT